MVNRGWCYTVASLSISRASELGPESRPDFYPVPNTRCVLFPFSERSPVLCQFLEKSVNCKNIYLFEKRARVS